MLVHRRRIASWALSLTLLALAVGCAPVAVPTFDDSRNNGVGGFNGTGSSTGASTTSDPTPTPTPAVAAVPYGTLSWSKAGTMAVPVTNTAGAVVDGHFVVVGGTNPNGLQDGVNAYPVAGATLTPTATPLTRYRLNILNGGVSSHGVYAFGPDVLVAGGQSPFTHGSDVVSALTNALGGGIWSDTPFFPTNDTIDGGRQDFGVAQTDTMAFVVGGAVGGDHSTPGTPTAAILVGTYSNASVTWTKAGTLPGATLQPAAVVANQRLYVYGGQVGSSLTNTVTSYAVNGNGTLGAPQTETSELAPAGSLEAASGASMFAFGNNLYLVGGMNDTGPRTTCYVAVIGADGKLSKWKQAGALPDRVACAAAGTDTAGHFYLAGGSTADSGATGPGVANDGLYVGTATLP